MGKLSGMVCLIAGGTGASGEAIVQAFLQAGATVVVPSRTSEKLTQLATYLGPLANEHFVPLPGDIGNQEGAERIREKVLSRFGQLDAVVASLSGSLGERQPLCETPVDSFMRFQQQSLMRHFVAARTFLPTLSVWRGSSYTFLSGQYALQAVPRYGPVCVNSAAQLMMVRTFIEELRGSLVRINQVICANIQTRGRAATARPEWISAEEVAEYLVYLASADARMVSGSIIQLGDRPPPDASASAKKPPIN